MFQKYRSKHPSRKIFVRGLAVFLGFLLMCGGMLHTGSVSAAQAEPSVSAPAAVLTDDDTGVVLFAQNEVDQASPASTAKIMTSLLALEQAAVSNPSITLTAEMVTVEGSSMGLRVGYRLTLRDLAVGMLTVSGNDAANSAAIAMAGSLPEFAKRMNERAAELGMTDTHFVTPSGLDNPEHYSTAYDMALLGRAALENADFLSICSQKQVSVTFESPEQTVRYSNHNRLLSRYEGCIGIKTGFTKKSGRCLVSAAERNGVRLVVVTLNAPDDWNDHERMFDYGFSLLRAYPLDDSGVMLSLPVVGGEQEAVSVAGSKGDALALTEAQAAGLRRVVELPRFAYAPVSVGQVVGAVRYELDGKTVAVLPLTAAQDVAALEPEISVWKRLLAWLAGWFS